MNKKDVNLISGVLVFLQRENSNGLEEILMGLDRVMNLIAFKALWEREKVLDKVEEILKIWIDTPDSEIQVDLDVINELLGEREFKEAFTMELLNIQIWSRVEKVFRDKYSWVDLDNILSDESLKKEKQIRQEYEHSNPILREIAKSRKGRPLEKEQVITISGLIPELRNEMEITWVFEALKDSLTPIMYMKDTDHPSLNESLEAVSYFNLLNGLWKGLEPRLDSAHQGSVKEYLFISRNSLEIYLENRKSGDPGFGVVLKGLDEVEDIRPKKDSHIPKESQTEDPESVFSRYKKLLNDNPEKILGDSEISELCKDLKKESLRAIKIKVGPDDDLKDIINENLCLEFRDKLEEFLDVFSKITSMVENAYFPEEILNDVKKTKEILEEDYKRLHSYFRFCNNNHPELGIMEKFTIVSPRDPKTQNKGYSLSEYVDMFKKYPDLKLTDTQVRDLCDVLKESVSSAVKFKVSPDGDMRDHVTEDFCLGLKKTLEEVYELFSKLVSTVRRNRDDYSKNVQNLVRETEMSLIESHMKVSSYFRLCNGYYPEAKIMEKFTLTKPRYFSDGENLSKDIKESEPDSQKFSEYFEKCSLIKDNEEDMKTLLEKMTFALKSIPVIETKNNPWEDLTYEVCKQKVTYFTSIVKLGCELSKYLVKVKDVEKLLKDFDDEMRQCHKSLKLTIKTRAQYGNKKEFKELVKLL